MFLETALTLDIAQTAQFLTTYINTYISDGCKNFKQYTLSKTPNLIDFNLKDILNKNIS